jgi:hypothetical protein
VTNDARMVAVEAEITITPPLPPAAQQALADELERSGAPFAVDGASLVLVADAGREALEEVLADLAERLAGLGHRLHGWISAERVLDGEIVWLTRVRDGRLVRQQRVVLWRDEQPATGSSPALVLPFPGRQAA